MTFAMLLRTILCAAICEAYRRTASPFASPVAYKDVDLSVDTKPEDAVCADSARFSSAYAQSVLAPEGGSQALPAMLNWLESERARRSSRYRAVVGAAIGFVARRKLAQEQGAQEVSTLLQNLNRRLDSEGMPLHLRLALVRLVSTLDRALYRAGRSHRSVAVWDAK